MPCHGLLGSQLYPINVIVVPIVTVEYGNSAGLRLTREFLLQRRVKQQHQHAAARRAAARPRTQGPVSTQPAGRALPPRAGPLGHSD